MRKTRPEREQAARKNKNKLGSLVGRQGHKTGAGLKGCR